MSITATINAQVKAIVEDVKGLPASFKKVDVSDLTKQAQGFAQATLGQATGVYADLSKKGEELVAKAKGLKVDDVKDKAEEVVAEAKATVTKVTGKAPAAKQAVKKPVVKTATKTAAKPAAKKPVAKATTKATAKTAAKPAAKKAPAKKTAPKQA